MNIEQFGFTEQFTIEEAVELLNSHVIKKEDAHKHNLEVEHIAFVAGVITLNEEVELMVKFPKELLQLNKEAFYANLSLLEMP